MQGGLKVIGVPLSVAKEYTHLVRDRQIEYFTVSLGGMSEISKLPRRLRCGPSALYSGFRNFEAALKLAFSTLFFFEKEGQESL